MGVWTRKVGARTRCVLQLFVCVCLCVWTCVCLCVCISERAAVNDRKGDSKWACLLEWQERKRRVRRGWGGGVGMCPARTHIKIIRRGDSCSEHHITEGRISWRPSPTEPLSEHNMGRQKVYLDKLSRTCQIRNLLLRQALAECLGTLILVVSSSCLMCVWLCVGCQCLCEWVCVCVCVLI